MRKLVLALAAAGMLAGCTTPEKTATVGALGGAAIGGIAGGTLGSAAVGAAAGAVGGYLLGKVAERPGYCRYRDQNGRVYQAQC